MSYPLGKLPHDALAALLSRHTLTDPRVIVGPRVGEDAAIIDIGDQYLVAKTDPITSATDEIGWYAVHVNANDIAVTGATPYWFMANLLLPEGSTDQKEVERIFGQITDAAEGLGVNLVGGHTEITYGISRPIVAGVMLGLAEKDKMVTTGGAREGDALIVTKGVPIEATAIIAREKQNDLADLVTSAFMDRGVDFLRNPGISVVRDARVATEAGRVHAMHDPTEGGLATGLWEMAEASGKRMIVDCSGVVLEEGAKLCKATGINPLGAIASGALLLSAHPDDAQSIVNSLESEGIKAHHLGHVEEGPVEVINTRGGQPAPLFRPERDEIVRLLE
jgi:hydrogenase maturation factor